MWFVRERRASTGSCAAVRCRVRWCVGNIPARSGVVGIVVVRGLEKRASGRARTFASSHSYISAHVLKITSSRTTKRHTAHIEKAVSTSSEHGASCNGASCNGASCMASNLIEPASRPIGTRLHARAATDLNLVARHLSAEPSVADCRRVPCHCQRRALPTAKSASHRASR
jgi:hypothetical protein